MGLAGGNSPFRQYQSGGQQMGTTGVNVQSKSALPNSLPQFPTDLKGATVTSMPNMVSFPSCTLTGLSWQVKADSVTPWLVLSPAGAAGVGGDGGRSGRVGGPHSGPGEAQADPAAAGPAAPRPQVPAARAGQRRGAGLCAAPLQDHEECPQPHDPLPGRQILPR